MRICSIDECDRRHSGLGYCKKHYDRLRATGDPLGLMVREQGESKALFESLLKVQSDDCILWPNNLTTAGYGYLSLDGGKRRTHREALICHKGPPPSAEKNHAAHRCGVPACMNYRHLYWATYKENSLDKRMHGTMVRGVEHPRAKLREEQVLEIYGSTETQDALARRYGVSQGSISLIKRGINWSWLTQKGEDQ